VLEEVSAFVMPSVGDNSIENSKDLQFYRFLQSHHAECQPRKKSFYDYGLHRGNLESQKRIAFANIGSWSTKEELPQGIIEKEKTGDFLMFQIESNSSWYYEIGDKFGEYYLYLGGANLPFGGWSKSLKANEIYRTPNVALAIGKSLNEVLGEMTKYRRQIAGKIRSTHTFIPSSTNICTCLGIVLRRKIRRKSRLLLQKRALNITSLIAVGIMKNQAIKCIRTLDNGRKARRVFQRACERRRILFVRLV
jgi:hypothetical protein